MTTYSVGDRVIIRGTVIALPDVGNNDEPEYEVEIPAMKDVWALEPDQFELDTSPLPEPAVGSVVEVNDDVFKSYEDGWLGTGSEMSFTWEHILEMGQVQILKDGSKS